MDLISSIQKVARRFHRRYHEHYVMFGTVGLLGLAMTLFVLLDKMTEKDEDDWSFMDTLLYLWDMDGIGCAVLGSISLFMVTFSAFMFIANYRSGGHVNAIGELEVKRAYHNFLSLYVLNNYEQIMAKRFRDRHENEIIAAESFVRAHHELHKTIDGTYGQINQLLEPKRRDLTILRRRVPK